MGFEETEKMSDNSIDVIKKSSAQMEYELVHSGSKYE